MNGARLSILLSAILALTLLSPQPASEAAGEPGVEAAQRRLNEIGFDPGPADGLLGPRTRKAIRAFQKANGIKASGRLNARTLNALFPTVSIEQTPPAPGGILSYETLGWKRPQSGEEALTRFRRQTGSLEMKRSRGELVVPDGEGIYLIGAGDAVPGFDCEPGKGLVEMEFMLGPGGPVVFRPLDSLGYCRLGFGILLAVGQRLRIAAAGADGGGIRKGLVEVAAQGLVYVETE